MLDKIKDKESNVYSVLCTYTYNNKDFIIYTDYKTNNNIIDIKYGEHINNTIKPIENDKEIKVAESIIESLKEE